MITISDQINEFIQIEGKGNIRDALNVAITKLALVTTVLERMKERIKKIDNGVLLCPACDRKLRLQDGYWYCDNDTCELAPEE